MKQDGLRSFKQRLDPSLSQMGYSCVQMSFKGKILQIMIERIDGSFISIKDCTRVTRRALELLEEEDSIGGNYTLEVSSAGLDRPLVTREDFERFVGSEVRLSTFQGEEGQKRFQGKILGVLKDILMLEITLGPEKKILEISLSNIRKANLKPVFEL